MYFNFATYTRILTITPNDFSVCIRISVDSSQLIQLSIKVRRSTKAVGRTLRLSAKPKNLSTFVFKELYGSQTFQWPSSHSSRGHLF
jgi:hypothetical protein